MITRAYMTIWCNLTENESRPRKKVSTSTTNKLLIAALCVVLEPGARKSKWNKIKLIVYGFWWKYSLGLIKPLTASNSVWSVSNVFVISLVSFNCSFTMSVYLSTAFINWFLNILKNEEKKFTLCTNNQSRSWWQTCAFLYLFNQFIRQFQFFRALILGPFGDGHFTW